MSDKLPDQGENAPQQPGLRFLEITVYIMGGLLVLMLIALLGGIGWKITHRAPPAAEPTKQLDLDLSAAGLSQVALDGDRLVLRSGAEIVVVDTRLGTVIARIRLKP
jgi:hypothetical protein